MGVRIDKTERQTARYLHRSGLKAVETSTNLNLDKNDNKKKNDAGGLPEKDEEARRKL